MTDISSKIRLLSKSRTAATQRVSCIIAAGRFGGDYCLLKNRDRNYDPEVKVVHETRNGVEMVYMTDVVTGWCEGLNEHGIGLVNTALLVDRDEAEGANSKKKNPVKRRDGLRMLKALEQVDVNAAIESIKNHDGGLPGHTMVSDGKRTYNVEITSNDSHDPVTTFLNTSERHVRTNHGIAIPNAGYQRGPDYDSSIVRYENTVNLLEDVDSPDGIAPSLVSMRMTDRRHPNNMVRDTENMRTTSQAVLNLDKKELVLYLIPGKVKFLGVENKLPDGYRPKLTVRVLEYKHEGEDYTEEPTEAKDVEDTVELKKASGNHRRSIALMKFLSGVARRAGVAEHVYVVGGAVRNFLIGQPIKDIDVVIDSVALGGKKDSEWFAKEVSRSIPMTTSLVTNQYGVAILTVKGPWILDGEDLDGEVIEIANARKESYSGVGGKGKGYKPDDVQPATIQEDIFRREFTFNTLLWRLLDLAEGPDKAEVIDLTGLGRAHLEERLMYTPLDPDRTFTDDPTRMLRAIKFFVKYGLNLSTDVEASIRRNAMALLDMPWEAVATILVRAILETPKAREALVVMQKLGLVDALSKMIQTVKPFSAYMAGQMTADKDVQLLLDLAGLGLGDRAISFLSPEQQTRLREITVSMERKDATAFLAALKNPPVDNMALIEKYKLQPRDRGVLSTVSREVLLQNPGLAQSPDELQKRVDEALEMRYPQVPRTSSEAIRDLSASLANTPSEEPENVTVAAKEVTSGILDRVKAIRMDWLWGYDDKNDRLFVRKKALYSIEHIFYNYMESQGWPKPVAGWVLTMAIVGGAASLQWKPGSDVDVSVVVDWLKLFKQMEGWNLYQWKTVNLEDQYYRIQKGERIQGRVVAKQMVNCLWGFGPWKGKGIIDRTDIDPTTMGHPVNYRFVRSLSNTDMRFDHQPPIVENASISSYVAELPTERRRQEDPNLPRLDVNWVQRVVDLPKGFELKRDVPQVYDAALGLLRYATLSFDYLWNPGSPKDIKKAMDVLSTRYREVKQDLRTKGYVDYQADPTAHAFTFQGVSYALPDAFPANIAVKLLEKSGAEHAIKELLFEKKNLRDDRYVAHNFNAVKAELRATLKDPYAKVKEYLKDYSKPITYK